VWCLKGPIGRLQSSTGSKGDELRGRRGAGMVEVGCPRRAGAAGGKAGGAAVELRSGVGETAKAQEEWFAGVFVVLKRVGVKALASCSELSTATARWLPGRAFGRSWRTRRRAAGESWCGGRPAQWRR
jgi:hypothetical protein